MTTPPQHVLTLDRVIAAPLAKVWRCWAETELFTQWFSPKPWQISDAKLDMRTGGEFTCVMRNPKGERYEHIGVFLDIVPEKRIVFTDAFASGWIPTGRAFMVVHISFAETEGNKTHYVVNAMHWSADAKAEHEKMGFHQGWEKSADQLEAIVKAL